MLYNKFSKGVVDDYVRKNNIAGSSEELTELQARQLIQQAEQSIDSSGISKPTGRFPERFSTNEVRGSEVLRERVTEKTLV